MERWTGREVSVTKPLTKRYFWHRSRRMDGRQGRRLVAHNGCPDTWIGRSWAHDWTHPVSPMVRVYANVVIYGVFRVSGLKAVCVEKLMGRLAKVPRFAGKGLHIAGSRHWFTGYGV